MSGWIILGAYLAGFLFAFRAGYRLHSTDNLMGDDEVMNMLAGIACGLFWPLALVILGLWKFARPETERQRQAAMREREREVSRREGHVRRMERELGIGDAR